MQTEYLIRKLTNTGIHFDSGLSDNEISSISATFDIKFPPDLRSFLQAALPVSEGFVNWRLGLTSPSEAKSIIERLNWPLEGLLYDLQSNEFWMEEWGPRPNDDVDKVRIAKGFFQSYPKLIPVYSHRYIPSEPCENDNPIFSVYQMDIIYYGYNLATYLANEFHFELPRQFERLEKPKREIEFWSACAG